MKACICPKYGPPSVLSIRAIKKPTPGENDILIKVQATTVNRTDIGFLRGKPAIVRLFTGLNKPRFAVTGTDFAGIIEATGKKVTQFKIGDRVMGLGGMGIRSHAEYLIAAQTKPIILIPAQLSYEQAAACLEGAFYAACGIRYLKPKAGQKAMVYGATGAIGSSMVQILRHYGLYITAACKAQHIELVKSLGADKIIDYEKQDFTKDEEKYDFVIDAVGKSNFKSCKPLLKKKGIYTSTDGLINFLLTLVTPLFGGKKVVFRAPTNTRAEISFIKDLVEKGRFRPIIDRTYPFDSIVEAFSYVETGQKIGNVIIKMDS